MDTQEQQPCFICRKHRGEFHLPGGAIYEDHLLYAGHIFNEHGPTYLGYLMAELKRHAPGLADQTDEEARELGLLVARLSRALKVSVGAEHVYTLVLGDHVPHLHIHLIARYPGAPREYWGLQVDEWPEAPQGGGEEVEAVKPMLLQESRNMALGNGAMSLAIDVGHLSLDRLMVVAEIGQNWSWKDLFRLLNAHFY